MRGHRAGADPVINYQLRGRQVLVDAEPRALPARHRTGNLASKLQPVCRLRRRSTLSPSFNLAAPANGLNFTRSTAKVGCRATPLSGVRREQLFDGDPQTAKWNSRPGAIVLALNTTLFVRRYAAVDRLLAPASCSGDMKSLRRRRPQTARRV